MRVPLRRNYARGRSTKNCLRLSDEGLSMPRLSSDRIRIGIPRLESSIIFTWLETKHLTSETTTPRLMFY
jgi:hypothetical protein